MVVFAAGLRSSAVMSDVNVLRALWWEGCGIEGVVVVSLLPPTADGGQKEREREGELVPLVCTTNQWSRDV